jgi:hypothetical protein
VEVLYENLDQPTGITLGSRTDETHMYVSLAEGHPSIVELQQGVAPRTIDIGYIDDPAGIHSTDKHLFVAGGEHVWRIDRAQPDVQSNHSVPVVDTRSLTMAGGMVVAASSARAVLYAMDNADGSDPTWNHTTSRTLVRSKLLAQSGINAQVVFDERGPGGTLYATNRNCPGSNNSGCVVMITNVTGDAQVSIFAQSRLIKHPTGLAISYHDGALSLYVMTTHVQHSDTKHTIMRLRADRSVSQYITSDLFHSPSNMVCSNSTGVIYIANTGGECVLAVKPPPPPTPAPPPTPPPSAPPSFLSTTMGMAMVGVFGFALVTMGCHKCNSALKKKEAGGGEDGSGGEGGDNKEMLLASGEKAAAARQQKKYAEQLPSDCLPAARQLHTPPPHATHSNCSPPWLPAHPPPSLARAGTLSRLARRATAWGRWRPTGW